MQGPTAASDEAGQAAVRPAGTRQFSFIDLFAGAGGFTLGLRSAGGAVESFFVEADSDCVETFRLNFPSATLHARRIEDADYSGLAVDLLTAGPPCQGFSRLNRNRRKDVRNELWAEVVRAVVATGPRIVVIENVPSFRDALEGEALRDALEELGYRVRHGILNAADYGVPQRRLRAIVTASRGDLPVPWPNPTHARAGGRLPPHRTVADALSLLPSKPTGDDWHRNEYRPGPNGLERVRSIREGGSRHDLPPDLLLDCWKDARGFGDVFGRLHWHRPATTVRTEFFRPEKGRFLHPVEDRPITPREAARIQSFPDSFIFPECQSLYSVGRQIGNAMPPLLAMAIGRAVCAALDAGDSATPEGPAWSQPRIT